ADLVIYDDRDGDGALDLGESYGPSAPSDGDAAGWERYREALDGWLVRYGDVDFVGLSSPSDPANEMVARAPLTARYAAADGTWVVARNLRTCEREPDCLRCTTTIAHLDEAAAYPVSVAWDLER
ncbi:MAG: hypothetical protein M3680_32200, partial [Myxococcota bacterium]|nr:hypothetical protein [Myxococcota bacterium]